MAEWVIDRTRSQMIFDERGTPINGVIIDVTLLPWGDFHSVELASMDDTLVTNTLDRLLAQRIKLDEMSKPPKKE